MKKIIRSMFTREKFTRITLPILLVIALVLIGFFSFHKPSKNIDENQAKEITEKFINDFLMQSGSKATIKEVTEEYGLYKLKVDIVSDVVDSYLTRDGKLFFPQALDIDKINSAKETAPEASATTGGQAGQVTVKNDKPVVELFVMSYCPYGTQIEKGILPVLTALGNKIEFELKFCSYAMHGDKELAENLNQYCIQKEQPDKLNAYLSCFLENSDASACIKSAKINTNKLNACVSSTDKQYKVTENAKNNVGYQGSYPGFNVDKTANDKYNVGGSPTLVINGQDISSDRDPASLLKTICSAFNNPPKECETVLSSASPSAGFGSGTATNASAAAGCQ
ncbi:MAG: hypothetical protein WC458_01950 [Patescibacteria group bacterium]